MVMGLVLGLKTLFWATALLFFVVYVMAVFFANLLGPVENEIIGLEGERLFMSVDRCMFTAFRCSLGDCTTSKGQPIVKLLADAYGAVIALMYVFCMAVLVFGVFNLISAIYIE